MMRAEILTPWAGTGTQENPYRPLLIDDHEVVLYRDTTGQVAENIRPDPNLLIIEIVCDDLVLDAVESDPKYEVLTSEEYA